MFQRVEKVALARARFGRVASWVLAKLRQALAIRAREALWGSIAELAAFSLSSCGRSAQQVGTAEV